MTGYEAVEALCRSLPGVTVGEKWRRRHWLADGRHGFAWERPFSKADLKRFGSAPVPAGPILGVATEDLHEKEALLAAGITGVFTIPHFDGYPAVLVDLAEVSDDDLRELVITGWLAKASATTAAPWLAEHGGAG